MASQEGAQFKAEAILPLEEREEGLRVLVFFDGADEGGPHDFLVAVP